MNRLHLYILTGLLALAGLTLFSYKAFWLHFPLSPNKSAPVWTVEANISFIGQERPAKVSFFLPKNSRRFRVMDENFISRGFGLTSNITEGNRLATWSIRKAEGKISLYYRGIVRELPQNDPLPPLKQPQITEHGFADAFLEAAQALLSEAKLRSADTESMVRELIRRLNALQPDGNAGLLLGERPSSLRKADVAVRLLALAEIPSRVVHGIDLTDRAREAGLMHWIEVYEDQTWRPYDASSGEVELPQQYFPWWFGTNSLSRLEGGEGLHTSVSVQPSDEAAIQTALAGVRDSASFFSNFSLFSLPLQTQIVYRILLLLPIGALLVVVLRNVIGIRTFGTFMPVLIALAFRETELLWGLVLFTLIISIGLAARFYLENLKLLLVPRLAAILTVVILLMAGASLLAHRLGIGHGLAVALFPMVIMTMTIERMSIIWDELGPESAIRQGIGTLLVAALVYLTIQINYLEHLVFVFPELLLLILAVILLLGRYTGYRLLELARFRTLLKEER